MGKKKKKIFSNVKITKKIAIPLYFSLRISPPPKLSHLPLISGRTE